MSVVSSASSSAAMSEDPSGIHTAGSEDEPTAEESTAEVLIATMNLVTYACPVSIKPRRFALGLYLGTASHDNFKRTRHGVLQVREKG